MEIKLMISQDHEGIFVHDSETLKKIKDLLRLFNIFNEGI